MALLGVVLMRLIALMVLIRPKSVATVTYFKSFYILEGDSSNFLTFFKRATVLMAMGRSRSALPDLDQAIKLNPKFSQVLNHFIILLIA